MEENQKLSSLIAGALSDAQKLVRQEFALLRVQVRETMEEAKEKSFLRLIAGVFGLGSLILFAFTLVEFSVEVFQLPLWAGYLIATLVFGSIAAGVYTLRLKKPEDTESSTAVSRNFKLYSNEPL